MSLSRGMFFAVSALCFTPGVGLSPAVVGIGLTLAGGVRVLASYAGGRLSDRCGADRLQLRAPAANGASLLACTLAGNVVSFVPVAACSAGQADGDDEGADQDHHRGTDRGGVRGDPPLR